MRIFPETGHQADIHYHRLGRWYEFFEDADGAYPAAPGMFAFFLHAASEKSYHSDTVTVAGVRCAIAGRIYATDDGSIAFTSTWTFGSLDTWGLEGLFTEDKLSIAGTWCDTADDDFSARPRFRFTRLAPEILIARPPPAHFEAGRIGALWAFLRVYVHQRFQARLSWKYIKEYVSRRKRFVDRLVEEKESDEDSDLDSDLDSEPASYEKMTDDLAELRGTFTYEQASLCYHILDMRMRAASSIKYVPCSTYINPLETLSMPY